jgi:cytidylate kinase
VELQREMAGNDLLVMEGRDIGTVVFPDAKYKFFLTASPEERAKRRLLQDGFDLDPELLRKTADAIAERDRVDSTRAVSPLKQAEDATLVDSSALTKEETVQQILALIREKQNG